MATGTGITAGNRALKARLRDRKLPSLETRAADPITQASLETLAEHLRVYEGDVRAPKERFITLKELEDAGLIKTGTKSGYAYIAQVLQRDVAQKAGSTANPSLKGVIKKDTSRQSRTPGGGGGGGSATNPIEVGKSGQGAKLNDNFDVLVPSPAQREFLYYDGSKWTAYPLFKRENKWFAKQYFAGGIDAVSLSIDGVDIDTYIPTVTDDLYVNVTGDTMTGDLILTAADITLDNGEELWIKDSGGTARRVFTLWTDDTLYVGETGGVHANSYRGSSHSFDANIDINAGTGDSSITIESSTGDAALYIKADTDNNVETDNPFVRMEQDANGVQLILGLTGADNVDPQGNTFTNSGNNGVALRNGYTSGTINIGVGTSVGLKLASDNDVTVFNNLYPAGGQTVGCFVDMPASSYGSVCVDGAEVNSTWEGYNINGRAAFMWHPTEERGGIYDDTHNRWAIQWNPNNATSNEECWLYNGSAAALKTKQYAATGQTSSAHIFDHDGNEVDVGFNTMTVADQNASVSLRAEHCGRIVYHNNSTGYNITMDNNSDYPAGGMTTIISHSDTALTFVQGSGITLIWQDGTATAATGNRTMQYRGVANVWKISSTAWFIWGIGLT